jgi:hypothetical protein
MMAGLFFEEFNLEQRFVHDVRRTVTETDNLLGHWPRHFNQRNDVVCTTTRSALMLKKSSRKREAGRGGRAPRPRR